MHGRIVVALLALVALAVAQGVNLPLCSVDTDGITVSETIIDGSTTWGVTVAQLGDDGNVRDAICLTSFHPPRRGLTTSINRYPS